MKIHWVIREREKFDNLCLLQDKKHYLGCKYLDGSEEDGYPRFDYKMVEADGTVVADMGTGSYWEQINGIKILYRLIQFQKMMIIYHNIRLYG